MSFRITKTRERSYQVMRDLWMCVIHDLNCIKTQLESSSCQWFLSFTHCYKSPNQLSAFTFIYTGVCDVALQFLFYTPHQSSGGELVEGLFEKGNDFYCVPATEFLQKFNKWNQHRQLQPTKPHRSLLRPPLQPVMIYDHLSVVLDKNICQIYKCQYELLLTT